MSLPNIQAISAESIDRSSRTGASREELEARRVAMEFEALLLTQLTSSLSRAEADEDGTFGSGSTNMYQQLFSEQIAKTMAEGGGIGMADLISRQIRDRNNSSSPQTGNLQRALDTALSLRGERSEALSSVVSALKAEGLLSTEAGSSPVNVAAATRPRRVFAAQQTTPHNASLSSHSHLHTDDTNLQIPLEGRITSQFGLRRDPINGRHKHHGGVDFAAPKGSPIGAAADGTVVFAGRQGGYGNTVVIRHGDGRMTRYAHAERLLVRDGDIVRSGQTIATVGSTGRSTGPHLHFEVTEGGRRVDPLIALTNELTLSRR